MWRLLLANLRRKKLRLALTLASVAISFVLFVFLEALLHALTGGVELAGQDRLMTMAKSAFLQPLPRSYFDRVVSIDGVRSAAGFSWLGGYYQEPRNRIPTYPILNEASLMDVYPEIHVEPGAWQTWMSDRGGVLVGRSIATARKWKIGDIVPIRSETYRKKDGSNTWEMHVDGIFDNDNGNTNGIYIHYDYFNESLPTAANTTTWISARINDKNKSAQVAARIDAMFENSATETSTTGEKAFIQDFANQIGHIGSIVSVIVIAAFFTMLLITSNTMSQSVRERVGEIAVMKTVGFQSLQITVLVLAESLLITIVGGFAGIALGTLMVKGVAGALKQFMPLMNAPASAYVLGFVCMVVAGFLSGALPCWMASQLKITDALRRI